MAEQQEQHRTASITEAMIGAYANLPLMEAAHAATSKPTAPEYEPSSFNHKYATVNGYKYHYVEEGNLDGIALVLIHGFPDMWYGWRYQIRHLAKQGYRVIAIDNLGTGETDHPRCDDGNYDVYRSKNLASNVVGLLDELKIEKAVFIGHDWGAFIAGKVGLHFPERCHTVISLGMPFFKPSVEYDYLEGDLKKFPQFSYVPVFQSKESDNWFDGDARKSATALLNMLYYSSPGTNVQEKNYYIDSFSRTTLHGPLSLYRASRLNHQDEQPYVGKNYIPPVYRITIEKDPIVTPEYIAIHPVDWYDSIEFGTISEGGHFATTENPDEVNRVLTEYLAKFFKK